jgi:hypothetical protein
VRLPQRLNSLLKKSSFGFVLKGRGFKPRRKCHKINPALATEAAPPIAMPLFQQTVKPRLILLPVRRGLKPRPFKT